MIASSRHAQRLGFLSDRDRRMHAAARELLSNSKYMALRRLNCHVREGVVEISGTVGSFYLKQMAQAEILRLDPAGSVRNLVDVRRETAGD